MSITIGTAPCSWGVWFSDGKPSNVDYKTFLKQASESGYKSFELGPVGFIPTDKEELNKLLKIHNLDICAGTACVDFMSHKNFDSLKKEINPLCELLKSIDVKEMVLMDSSDVGVNSSNKKNFDKKVYDDCFSLINELMEYVKINFDLKIVFHPHIQTLIEYEAEIENLLEATNIELCFDTGHHAYCNGDINNATETVIDFMKKHKEKITYLHFKNVDIEVKKKAEENNWGEEEAFLNNLMCDLDKGAIDYKELVNYLKEIDYNGTIIIEQDVPNCTAEEAYKMAKHNLKYLQDLKLI